jgi:nucleoside 2-deoxyribosyltransferase
MPYVISPGVREVMKIYIAGPEIFLENAIEVMGAKKRLCAKYGHAGICPFDTDIEEIANTFECGLRIAAENERLIDSCDVVIANITPFRGHNADPGTIYEIGYARAKGKTILAYTYSSDTHSDRICMDYYEHDVEDFKDFKRGSLDKKFIDDFGMAENAMIDGGIHASGGTIIPNGTSRGLDFDNVEGFEAFEACLQRL